MKGVFEKNDLSFDVLHFVGFQGFPPMFHLHCEIVYVLRGEIKMMIDGHERALKEGEISLVSPYVVHSYDASPESEAYILLFVPSAAGVFESELKKRKPIYPYVENKSNLASLFVRCDELMREGKDELKLKTASAYLFAIVGEILGSVELCESESMHENMIKPILLYCSEHFSDDDISVKKIADELYISSSYVSKVFSCKLKYNFREYINELRINKAKKLLSGTDRRIIDIMLDCGFKNQSSFNRVFAEYMGKSPSEYRRSKRKGK